MRLSLHHISINTNDYQATLNFYRDLLGFVLVEEVHIQSIGVRRAYLIAGAPGLAMPLPPVRLEILNYELPRQVGVDARQHVGLRHLGLAVQDIEAACEALRRAGIVLTMPLTPGSGSIRRKAMFLDPNGVEIELVELVPQEELR
jgi:catechol 2,3-dioxygenase-like lactoylglutathione lyase family enzyme